MSPLAEYRRKRDPGKSPEPFESGGAQSDARPVFVVQRHAARSLHYDFRLERNGVLESWAVPKGIPLEPGERHLAVRVEDHPLEYARFEGEIPPGQYGAGTVEIWDSGWYELLEEKPDGSLVVRLHGKRLEGSWALVPARLSGDAKNWLIVRKRERKARDNHSQWQSAPRASYDEAGASCASPTSKNSSGRRRGSPRAIFSVTTATSRLSSFPTCASGRSR
jgi:DNA ligase D-like protein (predicted 3'-phosphoesterase)